MVNADIIINWLTEQVVNKQPVSPSVWVESAVKLNMLIGDEQAKLFQLGQNVANMKKLLLESNESVSRAKTLVEASDEYRQYCTQKAKIERAIELIRLSKVMARMSSDEIKGY